MNIEYKINAENTVQTENVEVDLYTTAKEAEKQLHTQIRLILETYELNHPGPGEIGKID
ncbi:MAG: hypothetical protein REI78_09235 [Pedobacter sp.]|nr:hypothetical protein [Pedobacter sp.]